ncbi:MAG: hypothetical protein ABI857_11700 [Acidobacteriota bacterium]
MEELRIGLYGLVAVNIALGFFFGTFPLLAGILRGNRKYAFLGFVLSIVGGGLLGILLSYPLSMIFLWLILRDPANATVANGPAESGEVTV